MSKKPKTYKFTYRSSMKISKKEHNTTVLFEGFGNTASQQKSIWGGEKASLR